MTEIMAVSNVRTVFNPFKAPSYDETIYIGRVE